MRSPALAALMAACTLQNGVPLVSLQAELPASTSRVAASAMAGRPIAATVASSKVRGRIRTGIEYKVTASLPRHTTPRRHAERVVGAVKNCPQVISEFLRKRIGEPAAAWL